MATIGIRLANAVLFVLSCSVAANVITDVGASALIPTRVAAPPPRQVEAPAPKQWQDRQVILERNLFGSKVVDEPIEVVEVIEDEEAEDSKLPYKLLGTIASDEQVIASAALLNNQTRKHEVVRVGDTLSSHSQVSVERIERGRILLRNGTRLEQLELDDKVAQANIPTPARRPRAARPEPRSRRPSPTVRDRLQELTDEQGPRSPAAIFSQARILPKYEDGAMVGIELSKIKEGSFYEQVGLGDGDIVTSLNGVAIDNPSASKQLLEAFTSADSLTAEVRRAGGGTEMITVDADLLDQCGGLE